MVSIIYLSYKSLTCNADRSPPCQLPTVLSIIPVLAALVEEWALSNTTAQIPRARVVSIPIVIVPACLDNGLSRTHIKARVWAIISYGRCYHSPRVGQQMTDNAAAAIVFGQLECSDNDRPSKP